MKGLLRHLLVSACLLGPVLAASSLPAQEKASQDDLPPFKMVRSLQAMQDAAIGGDSASNEMQAFMLSAIDKRLRAADRTAFDDPRNVEAAMIYAMSGGNPQTLALLVSRDIDGRFDNRLTDALNHYLTGKTALVTEALSKAVDEYRDQRVGPYLYLVLANSISQYDPGNAVRHYDQARLLSPGTNIEEAALRRSLLLSVRGRLVQSSTGKAKGSSDARNPDKAFRYASVYMRRFPHSPYVSQVADLFVELLVGHDSAAARETTQEALHFLDPVRRREVYLRIARAAVIAGRQELTRFATDAAQALSPPGANVEEALTTLYSGLINVPSGDVLEAVKQLDAVPEEDLSPRDRALRDAARQVADNILRLPQAPAAPPQIEEKPVADAAPIADPAVSLEGTGSGASPFAAKPAATPAAAPASPASTIANAPDEPGADPEVAKFLKAGTSKLGEIDALLEDSQ